MKLIGTNHIEMSEANLRALLADFERRGETSVLKVIDGDRIRVSVVRNENHYTTGELSDRMSPYLPPEAWAGVIK